NMSDVFFNVPLPLTGKLHVEFFGNGQGDYNTDYAAFQEWSVRNDEDGIISFSIQYDWGDLEFHDFDVSDDYAQVTLLQQTRMSHLKPAWAHIQSLNQDSSSMFYHRIDTNILHLESHSSD